MPDEDTTEYVYAIGHPHGYVKIGRSVEPTKRLQSHQTNCPYDLWLIMQVPVEDSNNVESELHERLSDKQVRGEWFDLGYDDYDMLSDLMRMADNILDFKSFDDFEKHKRQKRQAVFG